ncbi:hypothetical protein TTHERM_000170439 (macronuclear) [Tetrahymena thermophila SB210]|uniref:Uncharacterized protein n=1 Tax=Tetrahymena thermophila (strain SB210) TaxID=312017 RepID=W7X9V5_TETTS|nr:hypothetical protein TTHERM_000170439 [Tetrahymena thermophila SB210]EWS76195.1 hypothetical protein TTHERM_000170439 [Tetrahymena thermophila SB210]|eukprot:XP_012651242.1 hypothetical protein TTHERM_000170439 [Tetrahymena thermophila SB210]
MAKNQFLFISCLQQIKHFKQFQFVFKADICYKIFEQKNFFQFLFQQRLKKEIKNQVHNNLKYDFLVKMRVPQSNYIDEEQKINSEAEKSVEKQKILQQSIFNYYCIICRLFIFQAPYLLKIKYQIYNCKQNKLKSNVHLQYI